MLRPVSLACLIAAVAVVADAQERQLKPVAAGASVRVTKLSSLMNSKILIQDDQAVGTVADIVLSDSGCVDYVVASYDNQQYVIPYSAVQYRNADRIVYIDITPAQFRKVQFFTGNQWPDFYASSYQQNVFSVFGVTNIRLDGPRNSLKPDLDRGRDRDGDRNRDDRDRDGDRNRNRDEQNRDRNRDDSARDRSKDPDAKPNPGVVDPPKTDPDAKKPIAPKPDVPKTELPKANPPKTELPKPEAPKSDKPRVDPLKPANPPPAPTPKP
jgi:hypothetical protein